MNKLAQRKALEWLAEQPGGSGYGSCIARITTWLSLQKRDLVSVNKTTSKVSLTTKGRASLAPKEKPSEDQLKLAWAAGVIDGEGCISLIHNPPAGVTRSLSAHYVLIVKVTMCCKLTVDTLHSIFKIGSRSKRKPKPGENMSTSYTWLCSTNQSRAILPLIRPYLVTKAKEADAALSFLSLPLAPRGGIKGSLRCPPWLMKERRYLFNKLRALKSRSKFRTYIKR